MGWEKLCGGGGGGGDGEGERIDGRGGGKGDGLHVSIQLRTDAETVTWDNSADGRRQSPEMAWMRRDDGRLSLVSSAEEELCHSAEEGWWETVTWDGSAEEGWWETVTWDGSRRNGRRQSPGTARLRRDGGRQSPGTARLRRDGGRQSPGTARLRRDGGRQSPGTARLRMGHQQFTNSASCSIPRNFLHRKQFFVDLHSRRLSRPGSACKQHLRGNRGWITDTDNCQLTLCGPLCAEPKATTETVTTEAVTTTKQRKVENKSAQNITKGGRKVENKTKKNNKTNKVPNQDE